MDKRKETVCASPPFLLNHLSIFPFYPFILFSFPLFPVSCNLSSIMRAVIQRVSEASVRVDDQVIGHIGRGLLVLLGVSTSDTKSEAEFLSEKIVNLRIFSDEAGKFAFSVRDLQGEILVVSQFTLYGDTRKGRRPSFTEAAGVDMALPLYEYFVECITRHQVRVATGQFQATMAVQLVNDGPVTLVIESERRKE
jgi:D-aminoacyl-tRNA deacylase